MPILLRSLLYPYWLWMLCTGAIFKQIHPKYFIYPFLYDVVTEGQRSEVMFFFYKLQKILNSAVLVWSCSKFTLSTDFINFKFETVCLHEYHLQGSCIKLLLIPVMDSFSSDIALQLCHLSLTFFKHNLTTILIWKLIFSSPIGWKNIFYVG